MITIIAAKDKNNIIGDSKTNKMPWKIPEELQIFKELTLWHPVVMGRKTAESVGPLKKRWNLVLSKDPKYNLDGFLTVDFNEVLNLSSHSEVMICGGAEIYKLFIPLANKIIISELKIESKGDVLFPMDYYKRTMYYLDSTELYHTCPKFSTYIYHLK